MTRVGVVMPTFNQHFHIGDALHGLLGQSFTDFGLVVVVDGPDDGKTASEIDKLIPKFKEESIPIEVLFLEENTGTANALNVGHAEAIRMFGPEYLTWVSSDNVMFPAFLNVLVEYLDTNKDMPFVYSKYIRCAGRIEDGRWSTKSVRALRTISRPRKLIKTVNCYIGPSFLYRESLWEFVGDHRGNISHDYDWWLRAEEECDFNYGFVDRQLCEYRVHSERVTITRKEDNDASHWQAQALRRRSCPEARKRQR